MNERFTELVGQLLHNNFQEDLDTVNFRGKAGQIKILPFDGSTKSIKRFWGRLELADENSLCWWIEININGKFHRFSYQPELEEPFVRN